MIPLIKIELSEFDAKMFVNFQKHYNLVGLLDNIGAFDLKGGSVQIHFDSFGQIRSIDKQQHYKLPELST